MFGDLNEILNVPSTVARTHRSEPYIHQRQTREGDLPVSPAHDDGAVHKRVVETVVVIRPRDSEGETVGGVAIQIG